MSNLKVVLNSAGIMELLKSVEMQTMLGEQAADIAARCGDGYAYDTYMTPGRIVASVYTESDEAIKDNLDNNTILRNLS